MAKNDSPPSPITGDEPKEKNLFVVSQIGGTGSPERDQADRFKEFIVEKAAKPLGYKVLRADDIEESGSITQQIIRHLMEDDLVVADFTGHNPNVFYELAIRHTSLKPFIHMVAKGTSAPSDLTVNRYIEYDLSDVRSVYAAQEQLAAQIQSIEAGQTPDSPFTYYTDVKDIQRDEGVQASGLVEVLLSMQERLDRAVRKLEQRSEKVPTSELIQAASTLYESSYQGKNSQQQRQTFHMLNKDRSYLEEQYRKIVDDYLSAGTDEDRAHLKAIGDKVVAEYSAIVEEMRSLRSELPKGFRYSLSPL